MKGQRTLKHRWDTLAVKTGESHVLGLGLSTLRSRGSLSMEVFSAGKTQRRGNH